MVSIDTDGFDLRTSFLTKLLRGFPASALTNTEVQLAKNYDRLLEIDNELLQNHPKFGILGYVQKLHGLVKVRDIVFLLLDSYDDDDLSIVTEILDTAIQEHKVLTTEQLVRIYEEKNDGAPMLMVIILGEDENDSMDIVESTSNVSGLNLDAMKDFK